MGRVLVLKEFVDRDCFSKRYEVGSELVGFDRERIASLVERGLVSVEADEDQEVAPKIGATELITLIKEIDDIEHLNEYLDEENKSEKPRSTVVKAIRE